MASGGSRCCREEAGRTKGGRKKSRAEGSTWQGFSWLQWTSLEIKLWNCTDPFTDILLTSIVKKIQHTGDNELLGMCAEG